MKVDAGLGHQLERVPASAKEVEAMGFDGVRTAEMNHDPFFPLLLAAEHTTKIELISSIAVGFARSPMLLANIGHDLNAYSKGRVTIGLGSQIKPHITKRFSMPWGAPAAKMRELVLAMRAIWANWYDGAKLEFVGKFYTHTLMTPVFTPGPNPHGLPPIYLAGVGPRMTEVAGEVADGLLVHPFNTARFVASEVLPALERGLAKSGRTREDCDVSAQFIVATGLDREERERNLALARGQVAFYASTPAYKPVLDCHGWGDLQPRLNALSKEGKWAEMTALLSDELVNEVVIHGSPEEVGERLRVRAGDWCGRASPVIYAGDLEVRERLVRAIKRG